MSTISRLAQRTALKLSKKSPQLLFGAGVVGTVATVVLASRATLKAQPIMEKHAEDRARIQGLLIETDHSESAVSAEVFDHYCSTGVKLVRLYGPVVVVGVGSIAALTKSHSILVNRNVALTAAYTGLDRAFKNYRARVVEELGAVKDSELLHGVVSKEIEYEDKKGNLQTKSINVLDPDSSAPYSYLFDDKNPCWEKDPGYNVTFLDNQQKWANLQLQKNGHLFLNEVYDMLRIPHTRTGQVVGWLYNRKEEGDGYVDFGFNRFGEFVAGYERNVWLDFNVDGPILDLI